MARARVTVSGADAAVRAETARATIQTLEPSHVSRLRLRRGARLDAFAVRAILTRYGGRSVWVPETLEFALLAPWRHRDEVAVVQELAAVANAEALVRAATERCRDAGTALVLMLDLDETRPPAFYARSGLDLLEEVITYELGRVSRVPALTGSLAFELVDPADPAAMAALARLDHAAFPWLWRNSEEEFAAYAKTPGVRLFLGCRDGEAAAYLGLTSYPGWGHLDRIAIDPARQGQGYGREALAFAIRELTRRGGRRIGLSTQRQNVRSQRLYERFGFRRAPAHDYRLYGVALRPPAPGVVLEDEAATPRDGSTAT